MSQRRHITVAIAGAGLMGKWHAHAAARAGARIVAVIDTARERAADLARPYKAAVFTDIDSAATAVRPDVFHVCTPVQDHTPDTLLCLSSGAHVLCEKPVALDEAECRRLYDAARTARRLLCPSHQFLFQRGFVRACRMKQRIAPLRAITLDSFTAGADRISTDQGELVASILPHPLSVVERLIPGEIERLDWRIVQSEPGELVAGASAAGTAIVIHISSRARPTRSEARISGEQGSVHLDFFHGFATVERGITSRRAKLARPFLTSTGTLASATANLAIRALRAEAAFPGLRQLVRSFYASVSKGTEPPISENEMLAVARARDAIMRTAGFTSARAQS